jgi:hypothetical protein
VNQTIDSSRSLSYRPTATSAARRDYLGHQNLIRGAIAQAKSRNLGTKGGGTKGGGTKGGRTKGGRAFQRLRSDLRRVALEARAKLNDADLDPFLTWTDNILETMLPEFSRSQVGFDYLAGFALRIPVVSLRREIVWISNV